MQLQALAWLGISVGAPILYIGVVDGQKRLFVSVEGVICQCEPLAAYRQAVDTAEALAAKGEEFAEQKHPEWQPQDAREWMVWNIDSFRYAAWCVKHEFPEECAE